MKSYTIDDILALGTCPEWTRERMEKIGTEMTLIEILKYRKIPVDDRIWVGIKFITNDQLERWLEMVVTRTRTNHALHCGIPEIEAWAKNWLSGKDRSKKSAWAAAHASWAADMAIYAVATWTDAERKLQLKNMQKIVETDESL